MNFNFNYPSSGSSCRPQTSNILEKILKDGIMSTEFSSLGAVNGLSESCQSSNSSSSIALDKELVDEKSTDSYVDCKHHTSTADSGSNDAPLSILCAETHSMMDKTDSEEQDKHVASQNEHRDTISMPTLEEFQACKTNAQATEKQNDSTKDDREESSIDESIHLPLSPYIDPLGGGQSALEPADKSSTSSPVSNMSSPLTDSRPASTGEGPTSSNDILLLNAASCAHRKRRMSQKASAHVEKPILAFSSGAGSFKPPVEEIFKSYTQKRGLVLSKISADVLKEKERLILIERKMETLPIVMARKNLYDVSCRLREVSDQLWNEMGRVWISVTRERRKIMNSISNRQPISNFHLPDQQYLEDMKRQKDHLLRLYYKLRGEMVTLEQREKVLRDEWKLTVENLRKLEAIHHTEVDRRGSNLEELCFGAIFDLEKVIQGLVAFKNQEDSLNSALSVDSSAKISENSPEIMVNKASPCVSGFHSSLEYNLHLKSPHIIPEKSSSPWSLESPTSPFTVAAINGSPDILPDLTSENLVRPPKYPRRYSNLMPQTPSIVQSLSCHTERQNNLRFTSRSLLLPR